MTSATITYNKSTIITGLRCKEKIHEDLISDSEAKMTYKIGNYYHIGITQLAHNIKSFNSNMNLIDKKTLEAYLVQKDLFKST